MWQPPSAVKPQQLALGCAVTNEIWIRPRRQCRVFTVAVVRAPHVSATVQSGGRAIGLPDGPQSNGVPHCTHPAPDGRDPCTSGWGLTTRAPVLLRSLISSASVPYHLRIVGSSPSLIKSLPKLRPFSRPIKASGARSRPSTMSSQYFSSPLRTSGAAIARYSPKRCH
jgi:hypothetical protein